MGSNHLAYMQAKLLLLEEKSGALFVFNNSICSCVKENQKCLLQAWYILHCGFAK